MTASVNGWRVLTRAECEDIEVPGGRIPVHPRLIVVFSDLAHRWHADVEPLVWPGCWGWADRPIRGGTVTSNHASGTAVDLSAPLHPQGKAASATLSAAQLHVIRSQLLPRYRGVLDWGGNWRLPTTDAMHWEVADGVTLDQVDALSAALLESQRGPAPVTPAPGPQPPERPLAPPAPPSGWTGPDLTGSAFALRGDVGNNGPRVLGLQEGLRRRYPAYASRLAVDGWWGEQTTGVLREFAARSGVRGADGRNIGPIIARKLYLAGFRL